MLRRRRALVVAALVAWPACVGRAPIDGGAPVDAGAPAGDDAGRRQDDAGAAFDGGGFVDGGRFVDGGAVDGGELLDGGAFVDGGPLVDGGSPVDAGGTHDGGDGGAGVGRAVVACDDPSGACVTLSLPGGEEVAIAPFLVEVAVDGAAADVVLQLDDDVVAAGADIAHVVDPWEHADAVVRVAAELALDDDAGRRFLTAGLDVVFGAQPPLISVAAPLDGAELAVDATAVDVAATATDALGVASFAVHVDDGGALPLSADGAPTSIPLPPTTTYPATTTLSFRAVDVSGVAWTRIVHVVRDPTVLRLRSTAANAGGPVDVLVSGDAVVVRTASGHLYGWPAAVDGAPTLVVPAAPPVREILAVDGVVFGWRTSDTALYVLRATIAGAVSTLAVVDGYGFVFGRRPPFVDDAGHVVFRARDAATGPTELVYDVAGGVVSTSPPPADFDPNAFTGADGRVWTYTDGGWRSADEDGGAVVTTSGPAPGFLPGPVYWADDEILVVGGYNVQSGAETYSAFSSVDGALRFHRHVGSASVYDVRRGLDGDLRLVVSGAAYAALDEIQGGVAFQRYRRADAYWMQGLPPWHFAQATLTSLAFELVDADGLVVWRRDVGWGGALADLGPDAGVLFADGDGGIERFDALGATRWTAAAPSDVVRGWAGVLPGIVIVAFDHPQVRLAGYQARADDDGAVLWTYALDGVEVEGFAAPVVVGDVLLLPFAHVTGGGRTFQRGTLIVGVPIP